MARKADLTALLRRLRYELIDAGCPEESDAAPGEPAPFTFRRDADSVAQRIAQRAQHFAADASRKVRGPSKLKLAQLSKAMRRARGLLADLDSGTVLSLSAQRTDRFVAIMNLAFKEPLLAQMEAVELAAENLAKRPHDMSLPPANIQVFADCATLWFDATGKWPTLTKDTDAEGDWKGNKPKHPLFECVVKLAEHFGAPRSAMSPKVFAEGCKLAERLYGRTDHQRRGLFQRLSRMGAALNWEAERKLRQRSKRPPPSAGRKHSSSTTRRK